MPLCTNCRTETPKLYWHRCYPDAYFCHKCWIIPCQDIDDQQRRDNIAAILRQARAFDREVARKAYKSLRGRGVPARKWRKR